MLKEVLQEEGKQYNRNSDVHKERKKIREGINTNKTKSFLLYLIDLKELFE